MAFISVLRHGLITVIPHPPPLRQSCQRAITPFFLFLSSSGPLEQLPLGLLGPEVLKALEKDHKEQTSNGSRSPWDMQYSSKSSGELESVSFATRVNMGGKYVWTMHMGRLVHERKRDNLFKDTLLTGQSWYLCCVDSVSHRNISNVYLFPRDEQNNALDTSLVYNEAHVSLSCLKYHI
jgi:hypothetical protein